VEEQMKSMAVRESKIKFDEKEKGNASSEVFIR
jgi:hypothetical protein